MKKLIVVLLAFAMLLSLAACGGNTTPSTQAPAPTATQAPTPATTAAPKQETTASGGGETAAPATPGEWETKGLPAIPANCLNGSILVTSVGQSSDADSVITILKRLKVDNYTQSNAITADAVNSSFSVLILAVGGSSKGLGGAGLDQDKETARVKAVIEKAQSLNMTIVCMHTGGTDRRGNLSDAFINLAFPYAQYAIIVKEGDSNNLMHDILAKNNVPTAYIEKVTNAREVLAHMLGK